MAEIKSVSPSTLDQLTSAMLVMPKNVLDRAATVKSLIPESVFSSEDILAMCYHVALTKLEKEGVEKIGEMLYNTALAEQEKEGFWTQKSVWTHEHPNDNIKFKQCENDAKFLGESSDLPSIELPN